MAFGLAKGQRGTATAYISRRRAIQRLQLSIKDFRRLCIIKGVYPVEPRRKKVVGKKNASNRTYYYAKDIRFLTREPLINQFRSLKIFMKRISKAFAKQDKEKVEHLRESRPTLEFDHIVKERYPTFVDALRDLDDVLCMCFLFSTLPKNKHVKVEFVHLCRRLTVEFMHYVMESRSLRKVFVSIKGIYYQAEIMGQVVTWIVPHVLGYSKPSDVDFKVMWTFVHFYSTVLGFVNFKLFNSINLAYPPKLSIEHPPGEDDDEEETSEFIAALNMSLKSTLDIEAEEVVQPDEFLNFDDDDLKAQKLQQEKIEKLKNLFKKCKIFLNREVPRESLVFIIRSCGGDVSFDKTVSLGATFDETDQTITHQIVDRPSLQMPYMNRYCVQPQWVYDSVNANMLLPVQLYFMGEKLPPHLSPFVEEAEGEYVPPEKKALLDYQKGITTSLVKARPSDDEDSETPEEKRVSRKATQKRKHEENGKTEVSVGTPLMTDKQKTAEREAAEEKRMRIMMMRKKDRHLYNKIIHSQKRKNNEAQKLQQKREVYEKEQKREKKKAKS